jgi:hypothetical protein
MRGAGSGGLFLTVMLAQASIFCLADDVEEDVRMREHDVVMGLGFVVTSG